jgi:hypothetical protein
MTASVLGVVGGIGAAAFGGGIDGAWVDGETGWVAHIDIEGLLDSQIGQAMLDKIGDGGGEPLDAAAIFELLQDGVEDEDLALAIIHEIRDVTVVGTDDEEPDLVVARTSGVVHAMLEAIQNEDGINMIEHDGQSIVSFGDDDGYAVVLPTADNDTYRVVVSQTVDELVGAIAAAQVRRGGPDWIDGADGKLVFLHVDSPADLADGKLPALLQDAGGIEIAFSEQNGTLNSSLIIETGNAESATSLVQMAQGMIAFGRMAASDDPELAEMLKLTEGLGLRADGSAVLANLSLDVETVLGVLNTVIDDDDNPVKVHIDIDSDNQAE